MKRRDFVKGAVAVPGVIAAGDVAADVTDYTFDTRTVTFPQFNHDHCHQTCGSKADFTLDLREMVSPYEQQISARAVIKTMSKVGDHSPLLGTMAVHSVVHARMHLNNLIDFSPGESDIGFGTFLGRTLIVSDTLQMADNVYETWLFGHGVTANRMANMAHAPRIPSNVIKLVGNWEETILSTNPMNPAMNAGFYRTHPNCKEFCFCRLVTREA